MNDPYEELRKKFKDGDWVFGIGEHKGCSQVFDHEKEHIQPFSYLNATNPDDFRLATEEEIRDASEMWDKYLNNPLDGKIIEFKEEGNIDD